MPTQEAILDPNVTQEISYFDRVRLGGDEPAICAAISLSLDRSGSNPAAQLVVVDVGFRQNPNGGFGPYDLDGSGNKRVFSKDYVVMRREETSDGPITHFLEVDTDKDIVIGRKTDAGAGLGLDKEQTVSGRHMTLHIGGNGNLSVTDEGSLNGTRVVDLSRLNEDQDGDKKYGFGYTISIGDYVSRAGRSRGYKSKEKVSGWGHGVYEGRPIIARDTPINGGVYPVGGSHGEALVIDDKKYPEEFDLAYIKITERLKSSLIDKLPVWGVARAARADKSAGGQELRTLNTIFEEVSSLLRYDKAATDALARDGQKIALNSYINKGVGVCRTQAALSAYFVERMILDGRLNGRVSIDRNSRENVDGNDSGHAWARYTSGSGEVFIIDPAQRFVGTLKESRNNGKSWDYRRTEDLIQELL